MGIQFSSFSGRGSNCPCRACQQRWSMPGTSKMPACAGLPAHLSWVCSRHTVMVECMQALSAADMPTASRSGRWQQEAAPLLGWPSKHIAPSRLHQ